MSGLIYDLAIVENCGTYWRVVGVAKSSMDAFAGRDEKTIKLSHVSYRNIQDALHEGKVVKIPKTIVADEVLPFELEIVDTAQIDPLGSAKSAAKVRVRMLITPELAKISSLTLYGFTVLNNDLASRGYFITNENREEKYLEILETGNETLIAKLEEYLNYKDEIERVSYLERKMSAYFAEVKIASTVEDVAKLESQFLEQFYSTNS